MIAFHGKQEIKDKYLELYEREKLLSNRDPMPANMIAFHGKQEIKDKYLARVAAHRLADELRRGETGRDGKGCAVWCTLDKYEHAAYETELGIPQSIARLEDGIFESLPEMIAMEWPERFLAAIEPGADLSFVISHWFVWMLTDPQDGVLQYAKTERSREAILKVSDLYARKAAGENVADKEFRPAAAADDDADYADYAADYAAYAASSAAADYAAAAAASAAADAAAYAAARFKTREKQANKLVELLAAAPLAGKDKTK